jgi:hypothetical protein
MSRRTDEQRRAPIAKMVLTTAKEGEKIRAKLPRGPGGDALLSAELAKALAGLIREGMPVDGSCRVVGLHRQTLGKWLKKGQTDAEAGLQTAEAAFAWSLDAALGDQERALVRLVMQGAEKDPQVALGILAVRRPDHWAPAQPAGDDARARYAQMTHEELKSEVGRLLKAKENDDVRKQRLAASADLDHRGSGAGEQPDADPGGAAHEQPG